MSVVIYEQPHICTCTCHRASVSFQLDVMRGLPHEPLPYLAVGLVATIGEGRGGIGINAHRIMWIYVQMDCVLSRCQHYHLWM